MRIVFWTENYAPLIGGVEILARATALGLAQRGHECHIITNQIHRDQPGREVDEGIVVRRLPLRQSVISRDLRALHSVRTAIADLRKELRPDAEQLYFTGAFLRFLTMPTPHTAPCVVVNLQCPVKDVLGSMPIRETLVRSANHVTVPSLDGLLQLSSQAPELASRLRHLPNSLPFPELPPAALPFLPPSILTYGRLVPEKGFDIALLAFQSVAAHPSRPHLTVAGDGPERPALEALAALLGILEQVTFTGWQPPDRIAELINQSTLVMVPSRWQEPFGLVALEAAQMGRPVITTRSGGLVDIVQDAETGRIVPIDDVGAMGEVLSQWLSDPDLVQRMGVRARQRALRDFDFGNYLDRHLELYATPSLG